MKHCIKLIFTFTLLTVNIFGTQEAPVANSRLQTIKDKWMQWANNNVEHEKQAFLKRYNLNDAQLHKDQSIIDGLRTSHDQMIEKALSACPSAESVHKQAIYAVASKIFLGDYCKKLEIIHNPEFPTNAINAFFHYADQKAFITTNCDLIVQEDPALIEGVLRHEYSHIINGDNFHKELLQCHAWTASQESFEEVDQHNYLFQQSHETRADIYSAVNSTDHGQSLIDFLKKYPGTSPFHPKDEDRIALLKKIKAELDNAS